MTVSALLAHIHSQAPPAVLYVNMSLVALSDVPLAIAFVFLERYLKRDNPELMTVALWMFVCMVQVPMSLAAVVCFGWIKGASVGDVFASVVDGIGCYLGGQNP